MSDLFFLPYRPAYDTSGRIVPGAQVYFTLSGTNTASAPFAEDALVTPLANPVVANGVGRIPTAYLDSTINYRVRIYSADAEVGVDTPLEEYDAYTPGVIIAEFEGGDVSFGTITGLSTVTTRNLLAAVPTTAVMVWLSEVGREGPFKWSSSNLATKVTADPEQGIYVAPASDTDGSSGAWIRQFDTGPADPRWWGFTEAGTAAANTAAINAMFVCLKSRATAINVNYQGLEPIRVPFGEFDLSATIDFSDGTGIFEGVDTGGPGGHGTILNFPAGVTGIRTQRNDTSGATTTDGVLHRGGDACIIRNLNINGGYAGTEGNFYGIHMRSRALIEHVYIFGFEGDGIFSEAVAGGTPRGNANGAHIRDVRVYGCRDGMMVDGADTNIWTVIDLDVTANRRWGINDSSFLGNSYFGCHADSNGLITGVLPSVVSYSGNRYCVIVGQEAGAETNAPSGTTADNTWWYYMAAGGANAPLNIPTWANPTPVRAGGAYHTDNANAQNAFFGCYAESAQGFSQGVSPTIAISGGQGAPWRGSATFLGNHAGTVATIDQIGSVAQDQLTYTKLSSSGDFHLNVLHPSAPLGYKWTWSGNDLQLFNHAGGGVRPVDLLGPSTTNNVGAHKLNFPTGYGIGSRKRLTGTAAPTGGAYVVGDVVENTAPVAATPVMKWANRAAGSPGSWQSTAFMVFKAATGSRPTLTAGDIGVMHLDSTLAAEGKPIWWTGTAWVDATGVAV